MPNVLHEMKPADENSYSMVVMCIKTDVEVDDDNLKELQDTIMEKPKASPKWPMKQGFAIKATWTDAFRS